MPQYKHIFFDLDHTLWDHDTNCREALSEVYEIFKLETIGIESLAAFQENFNEINYRLWGQYEKGDISQHELRHNRFRLVFTSLGVSDHEICDELSDVYLSICPKKSNLLPFSIETLKYLFPKYPLHIITNGFNETQDTKMISSEIRHYFRNIVTSQESGFKKPDPEMFRYACKIAETEPEQCLMIGDNFYADVLGAMNVGMDAVFFNPNAVNVIEKPTFEIQNMRELRYIL